MVFGELLGGLAMRGGERMHEDLLRQRGIEDWQRNQTIDQWKDFVAKNWDNMDVDQQTATVDQIAPILGKKPKDLYPMITAAKAIHGMIPQIQATQESLGPTQRPKRTNFDTSLSPAEETQFQQWKARYAPNDSGDDYDLRGAYKSGLTPDATTGHWPDTFKKPNHPTFSNESQYAGEAPERAGSWQGEKYIQPPQTPITIGPIPMPSQILTPSIMAPTTSGQASFGRNMTMNQRLAQQKFEQAQAEREQKRSEIRASGLPQRYQDMAEAGTYGLNVVPYESTIERGTTERYKADKVMLAKGALRFYVVPGATPGSSHVIRGRELGGRLYDDITGEQINLPAEAEPLDKKVVPIVNDVGDLNLINSQRAIGPGNYRATIEGVGRKTQPRVSGAGANIGDEDALVESIMRNPAIYATLTPTAKTRISPKLANRGFTNFGKEMSEGSMKQIAQSQSAIDSLKYLSGVIKENEDKMGPIAGWYGTLNPWSEARKVQANIDMVRQEVGKALEGGVLRKEDEIKYKAILATLFDVPSTAQYKLNELVKNIQRSIDSYQTQLSKGGRAADLSKPGAGAGDYGPIQDFNYNGKVVKGRRNTKTGKIKLEP